jgi:hypothetical protein
VGEIVVWCKYSTCVLVCQMNVNEHLEMFMSEGFAEAEKFEEDKKELMLVKFAFVYDF